MPKSLYQTLMHPTLNIQKIVYLEEWNKPPTEKSFKKIQKMIEKVYSDMLKLSNSKD